MTFLISQNHPLTLAKGYEHKVASITSMTKTFNVAGIKGSLIFAKDQALISKMSQQQRLSDEHDLNLLAYEVMRSAYEEGGDWLAQLLVYIEANIELTLDSLQ